MIKIEKDLKKIPPSLLKNPPKIENDVKTRLEKLYSSKCCYCESKTEGEVEHFYPKSKYPEKEFDWENLLWACNKCNKHKSDTFELENNQPLFVNPEKENPEKWLEFTKKGEILSNYNRMKYTINKCNLNREWLIEQRKTVFDEFRREIESCKSFEIDKNTKKTLFKNFIINYTNRQNGYISFRKYIITKWLNEML